MIRAVRRFVAAATACGLLVSGPWPAAFASGRPARAVGFQPMTEALTLATGLVRAPITPQRRVKTIRWIRPSSNGRVAASVAPFALVALASVLIPQAFGDGLLFAAVPMMKSLLDDPDSDFQELERRLHQTPRFGERLQVLRLWLSIGGADVARGISVAPELVNDWEAGRRLPAIQDAARLYVFLRTALEARYGDEVPMDRLHLSSYLAYLMSDEPHARRDFLTMHQRLVRAASGMLGAQSGVEPEELAQDVWISAIVHLRNAYEEGNGDASVYQGGSASLWSYLYKILMNKAYDVGRKKARRRTISLEAHLQPTNGQGRPRELKDPNDFRPVEELHDARRFTMYQSVLSSLSDRDRFILAHLADLGSFGTQMEELHRLLDEAGYKTTKLGTVRTWLKRAKEHLREQLQLRGMVGLLALYVGLQAFSPHSSPPLLKAA